MSVGFKIFWNNPLCIDTDLEGEQNTFFIPLGGVSLPTNTGSTSRWGNIEGDIEDQEDLQEALDIKVDKEVGKGLSTNDFTNDDKDKLNSLENVNLSAGSNVTITGVYPNLTIASSGGGGGGVNIVEYDPTPDMSIQEINLEDFLVDTTGTNIDLVNRKLEIVGDASYLLMKPYQQTAVSSSYISISLPLSPNKGEVVVDFTECQDDAWGMCLLSHDYLTGFENFLGFNLFDYPRQLSALGDSVCLSSQDRPSDEQVLRLSRHSYDESKLSLEEFTQTGTSSVLKFGNMVDVAKEYYPDITDQELIDMVGIDEYNNMTLQTVIYLPKGEDTVYVEIDLNKMYSLHFFITPFRCDENGNYLSTIPPISPDAKLKITFNGFDVVDEEVGVPNYADGTLVRFLNGAKVEGEIVKKDDVVVPYESRTKFLRLLGSV